MYMGIAATAITKIQKKNINKCEKEEKNGKRSISTFGYNHHHHNHFTHTHTHT